MQLSGNGANNPAEPKNALAKTLTDAGITVSMSSQDLIAIKVAQHESEISTQISALNKQLTVVNREIALCNDKVAAEVRAFPAPESVTTTAIALCSALSAFYENSKFIAAYINELRETSESGVIIRNTAKVCGVYTSSAGTHYLNTECPAPEYITKHLVRRNDLMQEAANLQSEITQKRRDLAQIPALERQAKAALVSTMLAETEAGQRLLSAVTGTKATPSI